MQNKLKDGSEAGEVGKQPVTKKHIRNWKRERFLGSMPKGGIVIEIGVWRGEFSGKILDALNPTKLCLIDPWKSFEDHDALAFSGREKEKTMDEIFNSVVELYQTQIKSGQVVVMREMSDTALKKFEDGTISFAYVDGDHSYEGVKADLENLMPKLAIGGVMAFDDYHRRGWWGDAVIRAINEFLGQHPTSLRIQTVIGAQIAITKMLPLK